MIIIEEIKYGGLTMVGIRYSLNTLNIKCLQSLKCYYYSASARISNEF